MSHPPDLSVIVPTHNRSALLGRSLEALSRQCWPAAGFEVLVVADACQDDTAALVTAYARRAPYALRLLSHAARSAAATRNAGAAQARGSTLLFLDDDVAARPGLVRAHVEAQHQNGVVLGYSKPVLPARPSWYQRDAHRWWEDTFREIGRRGHRFSYRDFFSGNVSMPAALFHQLGGFDTSFTGRLEDYEFGIRLLKAGARFRYAAGAAGDHYDSNDLQQWLRRLRQEGVADVQIGQRHPELRTSLFGQIEPHSRWRRRLRALAFAFPRRGDMLEQLLLRQVAICERLRLRGYWRKCVFALREYNYWRGVSGAIGGKRALYAWLQEVALPAAVAGDAPCIDLSALLPGSVPPEALERATSVGLRLTLDGVDVLAVPPQPGAEPLREEHLYAMVQELARRQFIPALVPSLSRTIADVSLC